MNKQEFLKILRSELERNEVQNISDIISDYEEHFNHGLSKRKTEEEISEALGFPTTIAKAYRTEGMIEKIKHPEKGFQWTVALSVIGRLLVLAPFNFFILFIPGIVVLSLLIVGWAVSLSMGSVSFAILSVIPGLGMLSTSGWVWVAAIAAVLGILSLAVVGAMGMFLITKYIVMALVNYVQWNLKIILQK